MAEWPRCDVDGCGRSQCRGADGEPSGFCRSHLRKADARVPVADAAEVVVAPAVRVESLRAELRSELATDQVAVLIRDNLLAGLEATKDSWTTCRSCNARTPVTFADLNTRVSAATRLLEEIEGKLMAARDDKDSLERLKVAEQAGRWESLTSDELVLLQLDAQDGEVVDWKAGVVALAHRIVSEAGEDAVKAAVEAEDVAVSAQAAEFAETYRKLGSRQSDATVSQWAWNKRNDDLLEGRRDDGD